MSSRPPQDALERTLVDCGVGSVRQLAGYYGPAVVERLRQARDTNYQLRAEYERAAADRQPAVPTPVAMDTESIALDDRSAPVWAERELVVVG